MKCPLYAKGRIFRNSARHQESTIDGRRWFTAGYKNDDLRKIFYAEGKGRNKKGFQDAAGVWWYPSLDDAELALITVIASAHNATACSDDSSQRAVAPVSESSSARETAPIPSSELKSTNSGTEGSLANQKSPGVDSLPGLEQNTISGTETKTSEQPKELDASAQDSHGGSNGTGDRVPASRPTTDERGESPALSDRRGSTKSTRKASSPNPSSSPVNDRHAESIHEKPVVREYTQLGDTDWAGRPLRRAHDHHSRSDRSYQGDRSTFREGAPSHRADPACLHNAEGDRGRRPDASDRREHRSAAHPDLEHGSSRRHFSEGDPAYYGATESHWASHAAAGAHFSGPDAYHRSSWWAQNPPPPAAHPYYHQYHPPYEYSQPPSSYHHRNAPGSGAPSFAHADLPPQWERIPPHALRGARGSHVVCVDGDYYKWFGTSWICRGPTYPD